MASPLQQFRDLAFRVVETLARKSGELLEGAGSTIRQRLDGDALECDLSGEDDGPTSLMSLFAIRDRTVEIESDPGPDEAGRDA